MRHRRRIIGLTMLVLAAGMLSGCADFDPDKLDIFGLSEKKKLPGVRTPVFPEGVPGVSQGIPPDLIKGNQPPPEQTAQPSLPPEPQPKVAEAPKPAPKRKPRPKVVRAPSGAPTQVTVQPKSGNPANASAAPWPDAPPPQDTSAQNAPPQGTQAPWPASSQPRVSAPWPEAPQPGTFSR